jgi:DNA modification methylase
LTRPNDIVLDPFVGSGTTCVAAKKLGRHYIGIDINPEYCKYAEERVKNVIPILEFFI